MERDQSSRELSMLSDSETLPPAARQLRLADERRTVQIFH